MKPNYVISDNLTNKIKEIYYKVKELDISEIRFLFDDHKVGSMFIEINEYRNFREVAVIYNDINDCEITDVYIANESVDGFKLIYIETLGGKKND